MNNGKYSQCVISFLIACASMVSLQYASAQAIYSANGAVNTTIMGTSNIHDWELISPKGNVTMTVQMDVSGNIMGISNVNYNIQVNTLKSKHGSQMDNNAYKAIDAANYPIIKFSGGSGVIKSSGSGNYSITAPGKLTISSVTKDVTLTATAKVNTDKSLTIDGSYKITTTDYNVKAISIMLGAIKTSPNVTINYSMTVKPQ
jgi:polyisoprenoid-binding protein YceI